MRGFEVGRNWGGSGEFWCEVEKTKVEVIREWEKKGNRSFWYGQIGVRGLILNFKKNKSGRKMNYGAPRAAVVEKFREHVFCQICLFGLARYWAQCSHTAC